MDSTITAVRLQVIGKVQGVFYRASTAEVAKELGLVGWVKNESDGSVSIHVQGSGAAVAKLISWAKRGPKNASVLKVIETTSPPEATNSFKICY